jgi:hypothetical protein
MLVVPEKRAPNFPYMTLYVFELTALEGGGGHVSEIDM